MEAKFTIHSWQLTVETKKCAKKRRSPSRQLLPGFSMESRFSWLVKGGAEFEDASAGGLDGHRERKSGRIVEQQDDPVKFAFTRASRQGKANGMKKIAAAKLEVLLEFADNFLEMVRIEGCGIQEKQGKMPHDLASGIAGEDSVGLGVPKDVCGFIFEDQA
jgi:hypothetical protein